MDTRDDRPRFDHDLKAYIYNISAGHIGAVKAVVDLASIITTRSTYTAYSLSLDAFLRWTAYKNIHSFCEQLTIHAQTFT
ncbi:hypothetical protein EUX98_g9542 [Antrodiella citrinella]|uniref:Uncharacterized protein n=1 Tax=Antrodiella citrinella TaxID=2447956 RepID=A0A4V3XEU1_9APHY|nr:hypothetical protein EUX98_g9542 [Antrodiella citrinella]